jgi:ADP-ribosyl-[dinitrogen reductase] hydrolase
LKATFKFADALLQAPWQRLLGDQLNLEGYQLFGAIAGDVIGSVYEYPPMKDYDFQLFHEYSTFTDDTVLTVAIAYAILKGEDYGVALKAFGRLYPGYGYGTMFNVWLRKEESEPYNSWGNGSAMRVSPVGFAYNSISEVLTQAKKSAEVTHNHPEGIKGAQATALAIYLARKGRKKTDIRDKVSSRFGYNLSRTLDQIRPHYTFNESCQRTVPEAIIAFLESDDYEDAIRKSVSLGGDSDTQACITGGIAQAYYKSIPRKIVERVNQVLPKEFLNIIEGFNAKFEIRFSTP